MLSAQIITAAGALVLNVLAARALGPDGRGELALILQVSYISAVIVSLGRDTALPIGRDNLPPYMRRILSVLATPLALGICLAIALPFFIRGDASLFVTITALVAFMGGNLTAKSLRIYAICSRKVSQFVTASILSQTAAVAGFTLLWQAGNNNVSYWLVIYSACALLPPLAISLATAALESPKTDTNVADGPTTAALGFKLFPTILLFFLLTRLDRLALAGLGGLAQLGIYTVVVTMIELASWPIKHYVDTKSPTWARTYREGGSVQMRQLLHIAAFSIPVTGLVAVVTYILITPLFGSDFSEAHKLVAPLAAAIIAHAVLIGVIGLANAQINARIGVITGLIALLTSVVLYFLLIPHYGALGASLSLLGGYVTGALVGGFLLFNAARDRKTEHEKAPTQIDAGQEEAR